MSFLKIMSEEAKVGFLFKAASSLQRAGNDPIQTVLKSYYLMRCREVAKDHGLPEKYFSSKVRCTHCFAEWKSETETKIRPIKLSSRQRRIKHYKINSNNEEYVKSRRELLKSNELVQTCTFCKHCTVTTLLKPSKPKLEVTSLESNDEPPQKKMKINDKKLNKQQLTKLTPVKAVEVNVYSKTKDIFSLTNKNNDLPSNVKEPKVIKNNKKKKDKFAGLCQQAVIASAKLKQEKDKQNKLNLFLKPSS